MFVPEPVQRQVERARADRLRVLIVGAGVAGLTLAQWLRGEGLRPVLVERAADHRDAGYMLALMPLVDPVLERLGVSKAYRARSVPFDLYRLHGRHGQVLREDPIGEILGGYGDYRGLARGDLMGVLAEGGAPVSYGTTLAAMAPSPETVHVTLQSGDATLDAAFDVVVLADGLHSASRKLLWTDSEVEIFDTGWGGWVAWTAANKAHPGRGEEIWGADFFTGVYPAKGRAGIFAGGSRTDTKEGPAAFAAHIRSRLRRLDPWIAEGLERIADSQTPYYWNMVDCRCPPWAKGRVVLLGDAASGFLPTAGIGAAMAMESAGLLARHLLAADQEGVAGALAEYERAERPRVEAAQDNSRALARMMFRRSAVLALFRDLAARLMSVKAVLRPIRQLLDEAPLTRPAPERPQLE